ncbi:MAG: hypothetical protein ACYC7E_07305 [Armatimonadota bacterium]
MELGNSGRREASATELATILRKVVKNYSRERSHTAGVVCSAAQILYQDYSPDRKSLMPTKGDEAESMIYGRAHDKKQELLWFIESYLWHQGMSRKKPGAHIGWKEIARVWNESHPNQKPLSIGNLKVRYHEAKRAGETGPIPFLLPFMFDSGCQASLTNFFDQSMPEHGREALDTYFTETVPHFRASWEGRYPLPEDGLIQFMLARWDEIQRIRRDYLPQDELAIQEQNELWDTCKQVIARQQWRIDSPSVSFRIPSLPKIVFEFCPYNVVTNEPGRLIGFRGFEVYGE